METIFPRRLVWSGLPREPEAGLIADDPDAPDPCRSEDDLGYTRCSHDPSLHEPHGLPEAVDSSSPARYLEGINDWKRTGYGGPAH